MILAFVGASLTPAMSWANVTLQVTLDGQTEGQVTASDPVAASGSVVARGGNLVLTQGSHAKAAVDLAAGTLRARSVGSGTVTPNGSVTTPQLPRATCSLFDTITVSGPGTTVNVTATLDIDGSIEVSGSASDSNGLAQSDMIAQLGFGTTQNATLERLIQAPPNKPMTDMTTLVALTLPSSGHLEGNVATIHLEHELLVTIGKKTDLIAQLTVSGLGTPGYEVTADFGSTARLGLSLPAGYSFTSGSGLLLSKAGSAGLPLPANGEAGAGGATSTDTGPAGSGGTDTGPAGSGGTDTGPAGNGSTETPAGGASGGDSAVAGSAGSDAPETGASGGSPSNAGTSSGSQAPNTSAGCAVAAVGRDSSPWGAAAGLLALALALRRRR